MEGDRRTLRPPLINMVQFSLPWNLVAITASTSEGATVTLQPVVLNVAAAFALGIFALIVTPTIIRALKGSKKWAGKHVLVTGGSQGIGKEIAMEFARRGAHVTIMARTEATLKASVAEVKAQAKSSDQKVDYVTCDVGDYASVQKSVASAEAKLGSIDTVVANAGLSIPKYFLEQDVKDFEKTMRVNYMGCVHICKAVAPGMCERGEGSIIIVASAAAVVAIIGYSSYAPSKWACRGFADSLRTELCGFGVSVHIAYPPDTDTPGFAEENKNKPQECKEFNELVGGVNPPRAVAASMVDGASRGLYHLPSPEWLQNRLVDTMAGVSPRNNAVLEWMMMPMLCAIEWGFRFVVDHFGAKHGKTYRAKAKTN
uniref:3-dehydrosphinganine reductase n=1 Tax=Hemiselmis andersenii TaxID=464988 RepID=A0A7S1HKU3_HEMAN